VILSEIAKHTGLRPEDLLGRGAWLSRVGRVTSECVARITFTRKGDYRTKCPPAEDRPGTIIGREMPRC
jgi:hypothetical protein